MSYWMPYTPPQETTLTVTENAIGYIVCFCLVAIVVIFTVLKNKKHKNK